jgi:hypothetical protein
MSSLALPSPALAAQAPAKVAFDITSRIKGMNPFPSLDLSLRYLFMREAYGTLPRPMRKTGFIVFILCSLLSMNLADFIDFLHGLLHSNFHLHWDFLRDDTLCEWQSDEDVSII